MLFALLLVGLLAITAVAVDGGMLYLTRTKMQNAADAAALAGAQNLPSASTAQATAEEYAMLNGAEGCDTASPFNGDPNKIEVICVKNMPYAFAKILGFTDANISARAVAEKIAGTAGGAFGYAVFSGSENTPLSWSGNKRTIGGDVHSNYELIISGSGTEINGSAEAVSIFRSSGLNHRINGTCQAKDIKTSGTIYIENRVYDAAPVIPMPDFSALIKKEAEDAGQVYIGDTAFSGNTTIDSSIYVEGNVTISGHITGKGAILASGNINLSGIAGDICGGSVCFYSESGNIMISGNNHLFMGLMYAPNGTISMSGLNQTIRGRVIGKEISFSGDNRSIIAGADDLDSLPFTDSSIRLIE